jgi:tetratricopeptide (TPR) repeat protein
MTAPGDQPLAKQRLGDFEIVREVGRGGMGVVYEARLVSLNRKVALKVLSGFGLSPKAVPRFRREAEAAAKLHHTNIVPVYATGEENGTHFYAMELIDGPSLAQVIRGLRECPGAGPAAGAPCGANDADSTGPYIEAARTPAAGSASGSSSLRRPDAHHFDTVARAIAGVADGLDYAHRQGVIHRDIKPSNLLLGPDGRLSINDFGLARILEQPGVTVTGELLGTPRYMSPEQITAGRVPVDHRTDIYSLGAALYELLTLQPPFVAEERDRLLAQVVQKEPRPPRTVNPKVPVDLETICLKAMDKDPDRRYQTAGQLAEDLHRYTNRFAIRARRAGPVTRLAKWVKRNPTLAVALAVVLVCAMAAGGLAYRAHRAERQSAEERARHEEQLLEEKRRSALEKAILAARLQDSDGARQAIREAEDLGCSAGQIHMLQGQFELYQGHTNEAIDHLRRAVELLPESVAAWSMLSAAYEQVGRMTEHHRALREATRLPAVTPDDYLFRGQAEGMLDPDRGLDTVDEAMRRRPSVLARLVHTEVLRRQVLETPTLEQAGRAMKGVQAIKEVVPENATVLELSILVHQTCFNVFDEFGQPALRQAALDEGMNDARALERFADNPRAVWTRWAFLDRVGRPEIGLADLKRVCDTTKDPYVGYYYGKYLYERGDFEGAVRAMELGKGENAVDLIRVIPLAELPEGADRARNLCHEVAARDLTGWDLFNSQLILRFLGDKQEAVRVSRKLLGQPDRFPPVRQEAFRRTVEYCAGRRSAKDLVDSAAGKRGDLCNAYFSIALTAFADGDRVEARRNLRLCVNTRYFEFLPYDLSTMLLSRMDKDPAWPPWIKHRP